MKHQYLIFIIASIYSIWLYGNPQDEGVNAYDSLKTYAETVSNYGKKYPQEIVFVHMDNTCYFLGDTLYYKAYVQRSDKGVPSNISQVLYAELFNQDRKSVV